MNHVKHGATLTMLATTALLGAGCKNSSSDEPQSVSTAAPARPAVFRLDPVIIVGEVATSPAETAAIAASASPGAAVLVASGQANAVQGR